MLGELISEGSATTKLLLHLNGNSTDSSGNSNNDTDTAITYSQANGKFGQGAGFNGSTSLISLGNNYNFSSDFTVSLWVKGNGTTISYPISKGTTGLYQWGIRQNVTTGTVAGFLFQVLGIPYMSLNDAGTLGKPINDNYWHLITLTYSSSPSLTLYLDGSFVVTTTTTSGSWYTGDTCNCNIGKRADASGPYTGAIDETAIYNYAWSAAKVAKYYSMAKGFYATL